MFHFFLHVVGTYPRPIYARTHALAVDSRFFLLAVTFEPHLTPIHTGTCDSRAGNAGAATAAPVPLQTHMRRVRDDSLGSALGRAVPADEPEPAESDASQRKDRT